MADASLGPSSFLTQADALLRKNLTFQKRNCGANCRLILFPLLLCLLLFLTQTAIDYVMDKPEMKCGCNCLEKIGNGRCVKKVCGIEYSDASQAKYCANPSPPKWAPLLQIPAPENRAVRSNFIPFTDLPDESCRRIESCPATVLVTGNNHSLGERLATNMFTSSVTLNISNMDGLANIVLGSDMLPDQTTFYEPAFVSERPLYRLQSQCKPNSKFSFPVQLGNVTVPKEVTCVQALYLWRNSSSEVNDELYKGYEKGNSDLKTNEIAAAYDFLNSDFKNFNVNIWYNATYKKGTGTEPMALVRVPRMVNLVWRIWRGKICKSV